MTANTGAGNATCDLAYGALVAVPGELGVIAVLKESGCVDPEMGQSTHVGDMGVPSR